MTYIKRRSVFVSLPGVRVISYYDDCWTYKEPNGLEHVWRGKYARHKLYNALGDLGISVQARERVFAQLDS